MELRHAARHLLQRRRGLGLRLLSLLAAALLACHGPQAQAAHKLCDYYCSCFGETQQVWADDSTGERLFVYLHNDGDRQLTALVLSGSDEVKQFAAALEVIAAAWEGHGSMGDVLPPGTLLFSSGQQWHTATRVRWKTKWKQGTLRIETGRLKDGKARCGKATLAFASRQEMTDLAQLLRQCLSGELPPQLPTLINDIDVLIE